MGNPEKSATSGKQDTGRRQNKKYYVLDTTIHKTQDKDKQNKKHNTENQRDQQH